MPAKMTRAAFTVRGPDKLVICTVEVPLQDFEAFARDTGHVVPGVHLDHLAAEAALERKLADEAAATRAADAARAAAAKSRA